MRCPTCRLPLLTAEIEGVELDYCAGDLGVWFDEGEIEELFAAEEPVLAATRTNRVGKRRCPRCNARMHLTYPTAELELDLCPNGDGIWFDAGEVAELATALGARSVEARDDRLEEIFTKLSQLLGGKA